MPSHRLSPSCAKQNRFQFAVCASVAGLLLCTPFIYLLCTPVCQGPHDRYDAFWCAHAVLASPTRDSIRGVSVLPTKALRGMAPSQVCQLYMVWVFTISVNESQEHINFTISTVLNSERHLFLFQNPTIESLQSYRPYRPVYQKKAEDWIVLHNALRKLPRYDPKISRICSRIASKKSQRSTACARIMQKARHYSKITEIRRVHT
ncbi:hypothetical protein EVAR_7097_1 [Eumeta japonica]|uniref:Uncharacterized protein n=1 Tax=Eumeta variegata TaxID=151549 RepID=A0A4C1Y941_EUMVA|nr:hypothetical protein EVAR_7097_1 [Eumeta japonica]